MFTTAAELESCTCASPATRFICDVIHIALASWDFNVNNLLLLNDRLRRALDDFQVHDVFQMDDAMTERHRFIFERKFGIADGVRWVDNFPTISCLAELTGRKVI